MKRVLFITFLSMFCISSASATDIGLKISAHSTWFNWGDYLLGQDLKLGFEDLGHTVYPSYIDDLEQKNEQKLDIDVYMHGFTPYNPDKNTHTKNILYLYYPLETSQMQKYNNLAGAMEPDWYSLQTELWNFDLIAVASLSYQKQLKKFGLKTIYVPQFTNPKKFYYEYDADKSYDILFVGRPGYERISAKWAMESGFEVALFGSGWQDKAPSKYFKGDFIDNTELHKYYASAKIVLNDTRDDMKKAGFISNRVFDVTASGGFLISDYMPEIESFYGNSIPMFKNKEELKALLSYYLSHPEERAEKAKQAQKITLKHFTNTVAAQKIFDASYKPPLSQNAVILKTPWSDGDIFIGDYWLGLDMATGLEKSGLEVQNYYYDRKIKDFITDDFYHRAANLLYLQFKLNHYEPDNAQKARLMYLYFPTFIPKKNKFKNTSEVFQYNTDVHLNNDLEYFDLIATPAEKIYHDLKKYGYNTAYVPQFTNSDKFYFSFDERLKTDLLFVGSTWYDRVSARYAVELGYDVAIYGMNWQGKIDDKYIKGTFIDNRELRRYYSSAKIVLSDHADDLGALGLVPNRLYDATACGAFVISEYSPYIEKIFKGSIPMFKNKSEFKQLVDYYLSHPDERKKKAKQAQKITLDGYTHLVVGQKFKQLFSQIRKEKP